MKLSSKFLLTVLIFLNYNCQPKENYSQVPNWAKDAIWYQIFPDRFNNGDKSNDPKMKDMIGGWPYEVQDGRESHPWTSDWYKLQQWEQNGKGFYWNVQVRRYGGDIQGVIDKLDYLKELGINAIYFNPVFESPSLHKYDATFYHHVDNNFGPDPEGDKEIWESEDHSDPSTWKWTSADKLFLNLLTEAHSRNIKVIVDGVFNHVGRTFWAFKDLEKKQENSEYKKWFTVHTYDNPNTEVNEFDYEGWFGAKDLPEITEDENGLTLGASNHVHDIVKRWMDPNNDGDPSDGIDGWRLDVADMVKQDFWVKFRTWVKEINPEAYITGEIWWDDWSKNKMMDASPWLKGDQFDAVMNYRFTRALKQFISDQDSQITAAAFIDTINKVRNDYKNENVQVLMNLLGSHDTERLASLIVNPDVWYDHGQVSSSNKYFLVRKPNKAERMQQKLMVGLQMTMPGAPMLYYGDEAGMWGGDDPDCRKPMVWTDHNYENESAHPFGMERSSDEVIFDSTLFNWYKLIISIRNNNIELRRGKLEFFNTGNNHVLVFNRIEKGKSITIIANNSNSKQIVEIENLSSTYVNLINRENVSVNSRLEIDPYEILILKQK